MWQQNHVFTSLGQAPEVERTPVSVLTVAALTIAGTVASILFIDPSKLQESVAGATTLMTQVSPSVASATARAHSPLYPRGLVANTPGAHSHASRTILRNTLPDSGSDSASFEAPHTVELPTVRKWAATGLAAVLAAVLTLVNRLRLKRSSQPANAMYGTSGATLERPVEAPASQSVFNNKGIVTPEEAVNLPFTMSDLKAAIPAKCFEKSLFWSTFYMLRDFGIVALMYAFQPQFFGLGIIGKFLWWNIVGFYGWCLFVVGHDCGHGSFSKYGWINQLFGHICHAPLLVPFNGWRISHRHHHQYHNDVDRDHSWRPSVAANVDTLSGPVKFFRFSPLILLVYPFYLISPSQENGFSGCHFWPWNPLFKKEERWGIFWSAMSVFAFMGGIGAAIATWGFWTVFQSYIIPYWIFVAWLDLVTLMQHTDENVLYFRGETWNYLRGAISTVDRTYRHIIDPLNLGYGRIIDHLHHNISDGHVVHHIFFTQIPHYRLMAATEAIKPLLGKHYRYDDTPVPKAFMQTLRNCWFVEDEGGVVKYQGKTEYKEWTGVHKYEAVKKAASEATLG